MNSVRHSAGRADAAVGECPPSAAAPDWIEEGRKHFLATKLHPERPCANYPTQDVHTPKDEADFILGFNSAKAAWERGEGLSGMSAYIGEHDEARLKITTAGE